MLIKYHKKDYLNLWSNWSNWRIRKDYNFLSRDLGIIQNYSSMLHHIM